MLAKKMNRRLFTALQWMGLVLFGLLFIGLFGCNHQYIEGTKIEDSQESRDVIKTVEIYRKAMEKRDADMLLALASKNYFEKNGDSNSKNNYDYEGLKKFLRSPQFRKVSKVTMKIIYKSIEFNKARNVATVRYHFTSNYKMPPVEYWEKEASEEAPPEDNYDEEIWHEVQDENEMILERQKDGKWYILKGM